MLRDMLNFWNVFGNLVFYLEFSLSGLLSERLSILRSNGVMGLQYLLDILCPIFSGGCLMLIYIVFFFH